MYASVTVHTIPYSQFKTLLAQGKVVSCDVEDTEIDGKSSIDPTTKFPGETPSPETPSPATPSPATAPNKTKPAESPATPADQGAPASGGPTKSLPSNPFVAPESAKPAIPKESSPKPVPPKPAPLNAQPEVPTAKPAGSPGSKTATDGAAPTNSSEDTTTDDHLFVFRTVRVDDPKLVDELQRTA